MTEPIQHESGIHSGSGTGENAVGAVDRKAVEERERDLTKAQNGPEALAGRRSDLAAAMINNLYGSDEKGRREHDALLVALQAVDDYINDLRDLIADLDARILELEEQRIEKLRQSQEAFDNFHEAGELVDDLKDGMSDSERARAVALLGEKAKTMKPDDIIEYLTGTYIPEQRQAGNDKSREADDIDQEKEKFKEARDKAQDHLKELEHASPEKRVEIIQSKEALDMMELKLVLTKEELIETADIGKADEVQYQSVDSGFTGMSYD